MRPGAGAPDVAALGVLPIAVEQLAETAPTVVIRACAVETTHASLAEYENALNRLAADEEFQAWYGTITPVMAGGHGEILTVLQ